MMIRTGCIVLISVLVSMLVGATAAGAATGRITNGEKVAADEYGAAYASLVSVHTTRTMVRRGTRVPAPDMFSFQCGGVLIAPTLVLTAAHCVPSTIPEDAPTGLTVARPGTTIDARSSTPKTVVEAVFVHPSWARSASWFGRDDVGFNGYSAGFGVGPYASKADWDVAVLRLAGTIDGTTPARLVAPGEDAAAWGNGSGRATGATAVGWGRTASQFSGVRGTTGVLHDLAIAIRSDRNCERSAKGLGLDADVFDATSMLCAGTADGPGKSLSSRTTCNGDDGSPLFGTMPDGSMRVVGIASLPTMSRACGRWAVFARIAAVRDWIAAVPATAGAPGDIAAPADVAGSPSGSNSLRITWGAPSSGTPVRYRVYREPSSGASPFFGPRPLGLLLAAVTSSEERAVTITDIEPRRAGSSRSHVVRVEVESSTGARRLSAPISVRAPIDARPPRMPQRPSIRQSRGRTFVAIRETTDNDCIGAYVLQVRGERWRSVAAWTNGGCDRALQAYGGMFGPYGFGADRGPGTLRMQFGGVDAGTYRFRVVAIDRAGNRSFSPTRIVTLPKDARGARFGMCTGVGTGVYCTSTPRKAANLLAAGAVDVVVR